MLVTAKSGHWPPRSVRRSPVGRVRPVAGLAMALLVIVGAVEIPACWAAAGPLSGTNYKAVGATADSYDYWREQAKSAGRIRYVPDPARQRDVVQQFEVLPGDNNVFGSSAKGERAEVTRTTDLGGFVDGQTMVMSWSVFIDSDFASPSGDWNNFVQTHASGAGAQSPWQLNLRGDQAELRMRVYGGGQWSGTRQPVGSVAKWFSLGTLPKNEWHDFLVEVRFGCKKNGYARLWHNGQLMTDTGQLAIGYCGDPGIYWKQGFYRAAYDKPTRLRFDDTYRWAKVSDAFAHYRWNMSHR